MNDQDEWVGTHLSSRELRVRINHLREHFEDVQLRLRLLEAPDFEDEALQKELLWRQTHPRAGVEAPESNTAGEEEFGKLHR